MKESYDPSGLSNKILKNLPMSIKLKILELFNECLKRNKIPNDWKLSIVSMLFKKNSFSSNISVYRPISLKSCLARLFERIILTRLQVHLQANNPIIMEQSGFRRNRQTKDNIAFLTQKIKENFDLKKNVQSLFFDISSAFDKVWHQGLLLK